MTITLASIRDAADRAAPRNFNGKANNPAPQLIQNADINWTAARGAISATGANNAISLSTIVTGTVNAKGSLSQEAGGAISSLVGQMFGNKTGEQIGRIAIRELNANADIRANVAVQARPQLEPQLARRSQYRSAGEPCGYQPQRIGNHASTSTTRSGR